MDGGENILMLCLLGMVFGGCVNTPASDSGSSPKKVMGQYVDNGNGTVLDNKTGLMWKKCSEGLSGADCATGKTATYTWDTANAAFGKGVSFAGFNDWHLPTHQELRTLLVCCNGSPPAAGKGCGEYYGPDGKLGTIEQTVFPNTIAAPEFWISSLLTNAYSARPNFAWYVSFFQGYVGDGLKNQPRQVRLVRGAMTQP